MCPACMATIALMIAGATSTGGLTALAIKKLRARPDAKNIGSKTQIKGEENGTREGCIAS